MDVFSLQPGMKVARTIYSGGGGVLLKEGTELTARHIKRLVELGVPFVYTDDGLAPEVPVEDVVARETRSAAVA